MDLEKLLGGIDDLLFTKNLAPEDQDKLYMVRGAVELEMERQQKAMAFNTLREAFRKNLERQNQNMFLGERLLGGPREIPGWQGGGIDIAPQVVPGGQIRDFVPNTSYQDRMNINPGRLMFMREKDRRGQRRI